MYQTFACTATLTNKGCANLTYSLKYTDGYSKTFTTSDNPITFSKLINSTGSYDITIQSGTLVPVVMRTVTVLDGKYQKSYVIFIDLIG